MPGTESVAVPSGERRATSETPRVIFAGLLFLVSGVAALVYQVTWQRLLALHSGVGLYSVAMIVAAFMAGLGIGSLVGGCLSARVGPAAALRAFALLELLIGAFGAASSWIYYDWLYPWAVHLPSPSWSAGLLHFAALLPPTVLMGMSLPFLVRAVVTDVEGAGRRIGWLYGVNVLGAAAGALATPWVLLPRGGILGGVLVAAAANGLVGLGALVLGSLPAVPSRGDAAPAAAPAATGREPPGARPFALWVGLYALSGFVALSLEVVWFRLLDVAVKSTAFTFGTVLSVYLLGSALGSLAGAPLVARLRHPLRVFLVTQCALVGLSAAAVIALVALPAHWPLVDWYLEYWASYDFFKFGHVSDSTHVIRLYVVLPFALLFLPTVLMGFSFPVLQRAVQDNPATSGRRVGTLQAANIAGCTAGSLLVGLVTLALLGTPGTLRLLLACGVAFALVGLRYYGVSFVVPATVLALLAACVPGPDRLWMRLHGMTREVPVAIFDEDGTAVVALTPEQGDWRLSINGRGNSWLPYGSGHTLLGALPASVHPAPRRVAVVGLGSGDTASAASYRSETLSTTVFEIARPQPRALWRLVGFVDIPDLRRLLEDSRLRIRLADGRKALEAATDTYDLIETDATFPETAGSGNLYSLEFFRAAGRRLEPGGVMCTWSPTPRVYRTFRTAFPHVLEGEERGVLIGSLDPISFEPEVWRARAREGASRLGAARSLEVVEALGRLRPASGSIEGTLNRDLFPRDELAVEQ
ncbi:MAG: fused MFS/spermidine synthase [Acidobacteria bacterium]|nr:fused MFS/spermidine synthase [Acidobacteriota bacterium]